MALSRLGSKWSPLVKTVLEAMEAPHLGTPAVLGGLCELLDHVTLWMDRAALSDARTPEELVDRYVGDAAVVATRTTVTGGAWVNPGARGGAPGLTLALLRSDARVTLVDSDSRCVAFLRTLGSALAPGRTEALRAPVSTLDASGWHVSIAYSEESARDWLDEGTRLARSSVWVFPESAELPSRSGWQVACDVSYVLPLTALPRHAVLYRAT